MKFIGNCKPLCIGSLPYTDPKIAWQRILDNFPEMPFWPQLPKRSYLENMYLQFSEHMPGRKIDMDNQRFYIDIQQDLQPEMERFYNSYMSNDIDYFKISRDYCEGLYAGLELFDQDEDKFADAEFIKGQLTGPISFGLQVTDEAKKPILYDEMLHDILVKNLQRKAQWQERMLGKINQNIILSIDEPYLSSVGSGILNLDRNQVIEDLETIFQSLNCVRATHCCGNTDWSLLMATSAEILLFDAYNYTKNVALFAQDLEEFLARGGCLGWGIVPSIGADLDNVTMEILVTRLEDGIKLLESKGLDRDQILQQSMITPACGLGNLSQAQAETAMKLTRSISEFMREKDGLK